ncbi:hypothetical protein HMPREF3027_07760 [Porphyromonas sp. HMSC077F02]|uniref:hypothetical protein n=1 Tax=Porphyromonas sp. HMSC077F02 TaxID=1739529 RepID=UPI0008A583FB|nr:hypothetical protein [Porphyromonas sp. HMSC077F02]OFO51685.1 hypothetical protein HMPREF3027_07760 [Porphyromonas sp. HMSC077F02]
MEKQNKASNRLPSILSFIATFLLMIRVFNFWLGTKEDWLMAMREPSFLVMRIAMTFLIGLVVCFLLEFILLRLSSLCGIRYFRATRVVTKILVVLTEALVVSLLSL